MLYQNTSVIQDEVLCHRLGLLPLKVDARKFEWPGVTIDGINENGVDMDEEPPVDPKKHLVFELNVSCKSLKKIVENDTVFTSAIKWLPLGSQEVEFGDDVPRMVQDDIIVAKMKPGQQIECKLHCVKGIGRDHAKFSPVATASYRLLPTIGLKENFYDGVGEKLQSCFSQGVIEMVDGEDMKKVAVVKDARADLCSRNVLRHEEFQGKVELGRVKNHFIFSVETIGALPPRVLVVEACKILQWKAQGLKNIIEQKLK
uniref:RPOLD domain-containing protein n=1 Tax=Rhabditophanes sp. KR3021 TaxID=114890 RepID=A0AC35TW33_9BILA